MAEEWRLFSKCRDMLGSINGRGEPKPLAREARKNVNVKTTIRPARSRMNDAQRRRRQTCRIVPNGHLRLVRFWAALGGTGRIVAPLQLQTKPAHREHLGMPRPRTHICPKSAVSSRGKRESGPLSSRVVNCRTPTGSNGVAFVTWLSFAYTPEPHSAAGYKTKMDETFRMLARFLKSLRSCDGSRRTRRSPKSSSRAVSPRLPYYWGQHRLTTSSTDSAVRCTSAGFSAWRGYFRVAFLFYRARLSPDIAAIPLN